MKYLDDLTLDQLSGLVRTLRQNQCAMASDAPLNRGQSGTPHSASKGKDEKQLRRSAGP